MSTDVSVLDLNDIVKVELKNDNVQRFNTGWNETIIAMNKEPDEEILDKTCYRQLQQSEQQKPLLSLHIQDTVQKGESRDLHRTYKDGGPKPGTESSCEAFLFS